MDANPSPALPDAKPAGLRGDCIALQICLIGSVLIWLLAVGNLAITLLHR